MGSVDDRVDTSSKHTYTSLSLKEKRAGVGTVDMKNQMTLPEVLMVAEKPSIAGSIAAILSKGTHQTRGGKLPVHVFEGDFMGKRVEFKVRIDADCGFGPRSHRLWVMCSISISRLNSRTGRRRTAWICSERRLFGRRRAEASSVI